MVRLIDGHTIINFEDSFFSLKKAKQQQRKRMIYIRMDTTVSWKKKQTSLLAESGCPKKSTKADDAD